MTGVEANFDGLVGPTHNYAGLSHGNVASQTNEGAVSNPRAAGLQGIAKMRLMLRLGLPQGVLAPHQRPNLPFLRALGYQGADRAIWAKANEDDPLLGRIASSASPMWTANAATVSASANCADGRLHFSVANLSTMLHRSLEAPTTERMLNRIFADQRCFAVHPALPGHPAFSDEGAANHMRLSRAPAEAGLELFVYGRAAGETWPHAFPARQTLEASQAIARRHQLDPAKTLFVRQSAKAIAAGAFHNDVVAVTGAACLFQHELAFAEPEALAAQIAAIAPHAQIVTVPAHAVALEDAIASYLFNAQLVALPGANRLALIAPQEAVETPSTKAYLDALIAGDGPIGAVHAMDLRESMRNGGGPACLRLRVPLTEAEYAAVTPGFLLSEPLAEQLEAWVKAHYRDRLSPADLADPDLVDEAYAALDALTQILPLGRDFYPFQQA
jgi:succinylarginine dihydrolase